MKYSQINRFKVALQHRVDTYAQELGYILPSNGVDSEGNPTYPIRKSYDDYLKRGIGEKEFDNTPMSGFIVNYKVGGHYYFAGGREPKIRVFDPRGFEIEITIPNLVDLLEYGVDNGKVFKGELVYCYLNGNLGLISTQNPTYQLIYNNNNHKEYTNEELVIDKVYSIGEVVNNHIYRYVGSFKEYTTNKVGKNFGGFIKVDMFYDVNGYLIIRDKKKLSYVVNEVVVDTSKLKFRTDDKFKEDFNRVINKREYSLNDVAKIPSYTSILQLTTEKVIIDGKYIIIIPKLIKAMGGKLISDRVLFFEDVVITNITSNSMMDTINNYYKQYSENHKFTINQKIPTVLDILKQYEKKFGYIDCYEFTSGEYGENILKPSKFNRVDLAENTTFKILTIRYKPSKNIINITNQINLLNE